MDCSVIAVLLQEAQKVCAYIVDVFLTRLIVLHNHSLLCTCNTL